MLPPRKSPRFRFAAGVLAFALQAVSCAPSTQANVNRPIEVMVPTEVATLDPRFATRSLDVKVTRLVHAGLVGLNADTLEPEPLVAESFARIDERTLNVTLRPGVVFHSGRPLRPEDVCATLAAVKDPSLGSPHRSIVDAIGTCTVLGPRRLSLTLDAPRATLLTDLEIPILRADQAKSAPDPGGTLDGLGPFSVASVRPGEITLAPSATNVLALPHHAVVIRTVKDENARVERLMAGRGDVLPNAVSPTILPALANTAGVHVIPRPGANVTYLLFQNDRAPFNHVEARRAVAMAIDRELIARTLFAGRATVADGLLPLGHWAYADVPKIPFSPDAARPVLSKCPPVTLLTSTDRARVTLARAVTQMLGDAGLAVSVVPLDLGVLLARLDAGDFDAAILQIPELTEPNVLSWFFHPRGVPGEGGQGRNRARYRSEEAGTLLDRASRVTDREERKALYAQLAEKMANDLPVIPLWHEDQIAVVSDRALGFQLSAEGRWLSLARLE